MKFTREDYQGLLSSLLQYELVPRPIREYSGGGVVLRHDVDDNIEASVEMAEFEASLGVRSTYYILNTAPYWETKLDLLYKIAELGHEIGWHNNAIVDSIKRSIPIKQAVLEPLSKLRGMGFDVVSTAAHGDSMCRNPDRSYKFVNYDIWNDRKVDASQWQTLFLKDAGLQCEAYWIGHTHYISESGGRWKQRNNEVIESFNGLNKKHRLLQILVHPQHWKL